MSLGFVDNTQHKLSSNKNKSKTMGFVEDSFALNPSIRLLTKVYDGDMVVIDDVIETNKKRNIIWRFVILCFAVISACGLVIFDVMTYEEQKVIILPGVAGVSFMISLLSWLQSILSMNLFKKNISRVRLLAILFYLLSGLSYLSSAIAIMNEDTLFQFICSVFGSIFSWIAFTVIFRGNLNVPTQQQLFSLVQILALTMLWELRTYFINMHFSAQLDPKKN